MTQSHIHFVTGKLAEPALREVVEPLSKQCDFRYSIEVLPITVAALMTPKWIARRIQVPFEADRVILPGYCDGDLTPLQELTNATIEVGPKDLRKLPRYFGKTIDRHGYGEHDLEIIAEINHAPRKSSQEIIDLAKHYRESGADIIDVGCEPDGTFWSGVGDCVKMLCDLGLAVSIDSLNPKEIEPAVRAGASLVLSVNRSNLDAAPDWGCEVVVIPDEIAKIESMDRSIEFLANKNVPIRIDPIIEPIGLGFGKSLLRYYQARQRWPEAEMMMGIGNISELTDVDSAGVNVLLLAICHELRIRSVLTTEVINWARSSVKECDLARQLIFHANEKRIPAKHVDERLILLRDSETLQYSETFFDQLAQEIKDNDFRIFADGQQIHLLGKSCHYSSRDPFEIFDLLNEEPPANLDPSHAFYLGFEMCKALTANTLGKQYTQDEALDWGFLTEPEKDRHRLKKRRRLPDQ